MNNFTKDNSLDFHKWKLYEECPKRFRLLFIDKAIPTETENKYFALYGDTIQKFFTKFCNEWRYKSPCMPPQFIKEKLKDIYEGTLKVNEVNWSAPFVKLSKEDIFDQVYADTCMIMNSENQNFFFCTQAEVEIAASLKDGKIISGRPDFIHSYPLNDRVLLFDGKGTKDIDKKMDKDQLYLYALLYKMHFGKSPDDLGWYYYRYNLFKPVDYNIEIATAFEERFAKTIDIIANDIEFKAIPKYKYCQYCEYRTGCKERVDAQFKRQRSKLSIDDNDGIKEFGF